MARLGPRPILAALSGCALAVALAGPVAAAAQPGHFSFYDCQGPAGTPTSFVAIKEETPGHDGGSSAGVSYHLEDGGIFVVHSFSGYPIGNGITGDKLPVSCQIDFAGYGTLTFSGFLSGGS